MPHWNGWLGLMLILPPCFSSFPSAFEGGNWCLCSPRCPVGFNSSVSLSVHQSVAGSNPSVGSSRGWNCAAGWHQSPATAFVCGAALQVARRLPHHGEAAKADCGPGVDVKIPPWIGIWWEKPWNQYWSSLAAGELVRWNSINADSTHGTAIEYFAFSFMIIPLGVPELSISFWAFQLCVLKINETFLGSSGGTFVSLQNCLCL